MGPSSLLLLLAPLLAVPAAKDPPRLTVAPQGQVDLGSLGPFEKKAQPYLLRNTSAAPIRLRVLDLAPGVALAGPALEGAIPAGAAAALTLVLDPSGWQGFQTRNARLATDDPGQGDYFLPVKAVIRPDLTVDGVQRDFGDVAVHESPRQVFQFSRESAGPVAVRIATPLPPYLEGAVEPGGSKARVSFTLRPGIVPAGVRLGLEEVRVETSAPLQPAFDLFLAWKVHHPVEADPPRAVFQDPAVWTLDLRLQARDGRPYRLLKARVEGDGFRVEPFPEGAPRALTVRRTAIAAARGLLVLTFEDGELRVPLAYLPTRSN